MIKKIRSEGGSRSLCTALDAISAKKYNVNTSHHMLRRTAITCFGDLTPDPHLIHTRSTPDNVSDMAWVIKTAPI